MMKGRWRRSGWPGWRAVLVGAFMFSALLGPLLLATFGYDPYLQVTSRSITPPTPPDREHPFGPDALGRDQLARLVHGARISLQVGFLAEGIALLIGASVGAIAGYMGGRVDTILMRLADLLFAFPTPLVALAIIAAVPEPGQVPILRHLPQPPPDPPCSSPHTLNLELEGFPVLVLR